MTRYFYRTQISFLWCLGKIAFIVLSIIVILLASCKRKTEQSYIDFVKVSEVTYLGVEEIVDSLNVPWDMQYSPMTNSIFFTEIGGGISELYLTTNESRIIYNVPGVYQHRTLGLLGLAVHPEFNKKPYLYVCYTLKEGDRVFSELVKLLYRDGRIVESNPLLRIDGAMGHNGSRLVFDKEGYLYWATGDAGSAIHSQDSTTLNGKILRMTDEGSIPIDNPIPQSYVYAWGFRNIQGMTVTSRGNLIISEHGDAIEDELNWIQPLQNYGWKAIEGYHDTKEELRYAELHRTTEPIKSWTPVIAPAALHYPLFNTIPEWKNSMLLGTLKDQSIHVVKLDQSQTAVLEEKVYLKDVYGRIRAITSDHKGNIYIATSNRDWKPQTDFPKQKDDRILKLSKLDFVPDRYLEEEKPDVENSRNGQLLYKTYCASCHMLDGKGVKGVFPSLRKSSRVQDKNQLVDIILRGIQRKKTVDGAEYSEMMPSFSFLSNREVAKIATYIRVSFDNNKSSVESIDVQENR